MAKSILLIEDEDSIALSLEFLMEREGYDFRRVRTGPEALAALEEARPDLVLLDVMLPGCSGYEVCQSMRRNRAFDATKILIVTARGGEIERRKGLALGADEFITKPFSTHDLKRMVRELLDAGNG